MGRFRRQMPSPPRPIICKLFYSFFRVQGLELGSKLEERCKSKTTKCPKFAFLILRSVYNGDPTYNGGLRFSDDEMGKWVSEGFA